MATSVKTIEFAFPLSTAQVNSATARDFTSITIYIPESSPVFQSVTLEMGSHTWNGTTSVTAILMGISLGAVARSDSTVTQTITNSGENYSFLFYRDVTSYFTTNWAGTSMSAGARFTVTGVATANAIAKLIITYTFNESTSNTRIKTVRIPMEGNTGALTTTLANVGGVANQIPNLSTFLPENSVVIRDIFMETYCHTGIAAGTTDIALNLRFDGVNTIAATYEAGATTDYSLKRIDKSLTLFNTGATSNYEASTGNVAVPYTCLCGVLHVTYEYNHSGSTTILNSLMMPVLDPHGWVEDVDEYTALKIWTVEPGVLTLRQSGVLTSLNDSGAIDFVFKMGAQTDRTYSHPATVRSGNVFQLRRFDSGGQQDSLLTVNTGQTEFDMYFRTTGAALGSYGSNLSGCMYLNYTSGKYSSGDTYHNKTTVWDILPYQTDTLARDTITPSSVPSLDDTNGYFWLNNTGFYICTNLTSTPTNNIPISLAYVRDAGDPLTQFSNLNVYDTMYTSDDEIGLNLGWGIYTDFVGDTYSSKPPLQTSRNLVISNFPNVVFIQLLQYVTSFNLTYTYSGTVTGLPDGQSCTITSYDYDNGYKGVFLTNQTNGPYTVNYALTNTLVRIEGVLGSIGSSYTVTSELNSLPATFDLDFGFREYGFGSS